MALGPGGRSERCFGAVGSLLVGCTTIIQRTTCYRYGATAMTRCCCAVVRWRSKNRLFAAGRGRTGREARLVAISQILLGQAAWQGADQESSKSSKSSKTAKQAKQQIKLRVQDTKTSQDNPAHSAHGDKKLDCDCGGTGATTTPAVPRQSTHSPVDLHSLTVLDGDG